MELLIPHCNSMNSEPICLLEVSAAVGSCKVLSYLLIVHDLTYYCNTAAIFLREARIAAAAHSSWADLGWAKLLGSLVSIPLNTPKLASKAVRDVHQSQGPCTWYLICMINYSPLFVYILNTLTFCGVLVRAQGDPRTERLVVHSVPPAPFAFRSH